MSCRFIQPLVLSEVERPPAVLLIRDVCKTDALQQARCIVSGCRPMPNSGATIVRARPSSLAARARHAPYNNPLQPRRYRVRAHCRRAAFAHFGTASSPFDRPEPKPDPKVEFNVSSVLTQRQWASGRVGLKHKGTPRPAIRQTQARREAAFHLDSLLIPSSADGAALR